MVSFISRNNQRFCAGRLQLPARGHSSLRPRHSLTLLRRGTFISAPGSAGLLTPVFLHRCASLNGGLS